MTTESLPSTVIVRSAEYVLEQPVSAGFKGVVWKVRDHLGRKRALKLALLQDYEERSYLEELQYVAKLEGYSQFAALIDGALVEIAIDGQPQRFVAFVEEWVDGETLASFLQSKPQEITVSLVVGFVRLLCEVLQALNDQGLCHDDLHARNIMVLPLKGALETSYALKIVDMGSAKPAGQSTKKVSDLGHVVEHIASLHNAVRRRRSANGRERRFLSSIQKLLASMLDETSDTALTDARQIRSQFESALTRASQEVSDRPASLSSPFEFLSAEHIADDRVLLNIFAKSCPWLDKVSGPDPCLVTGPRGCGKSTIFRYLSLRAHLRQPSNDLSQLRIAGFYISCNTDLQNRLGWIRSESLARRFRLEIVHYFNLLAVREVVQTLDLLSRRSDAESEWGFGPNQVRLIYDFVAGWFEERKHTRVQGVSLLLQLQELVEAEMRHTHALMLKGLNLPSTTPETFLGDLTSLLVRHVKLFAERRPTFLVDDFSIHRISEHVQAILNRVIWERRPSHVFKLSSEKYGARLTDTFNATADLTREMIEIDCGREFLSLDDTEQGRRSLAFTVELLDNRLRQAEYIGSAEDLLGHSQWAEGSLGAALAAKRRNGAEDQYHGLECIAQLCSGDVSSLLLVFSMIFDAAKVKQTTKSLINKTTQGKAIREAARKKLEAIKPSFPFGSEMYAIVDAFGSLVRNILQHGAPTKKGDSFVPTQCPRIEIDQGAGAVADQLTTEQRNLALELLRRAVFIEMQPGLSRHGNVTTLRWNLRRLYLPAFGAALTKNDAIKADPDWFKFLLTNARGACDQIWSKRKKVDSGQATLGLEESHG